MVDIRSGRERVLLGATALMEFKLQRSRSECGTGGRSPPFMHFGLSCCLAAQWVLQIVNVGAENLVRGGLSW